MRSEQINVDGMSCAHCIETIQNTVGKIAGVNQIKVSLENKKVSVDFDEVQTNLEVIKKNIIEAGFEVL